jgi:hypothetical protein
MELSITREATHQLWSDSAVSQHWMEPEGSSPKSSPLIPILREMLLTYIYILIYHCLKILSLCTTATKMVVKSSIFCSVTYCVLIEVYRCSGMDWLQLTVWPWKWRLHFSKMSVNFYHTIQHISFIVTAREPQFLKNCQGVLQTKVHVGCGPCQVCISCYQHSWWDIWYSCHCVGH